MNTDMLMDHFTSTHYANQNKSKVSIGSVVNHFDSRIKRRYKKYNKVLEMCHRRIKMAVKDYKYKCIYVLPAVVYGMPLLKKQECVCFLMFKLRKNGFTCLFEHPNVLHISWKTLVKNRLEQRYQKLIKDIQTKTPEKSFNNIKIKGAEEHFLNGLQSFIKK